MLAVFIPCLFLSHTILFDIVIAILCVMATHEMLGCCGRRRNLAVSLPAYLISVAMPFAVRQVQIGLGLADLMLLVFVIFLFITLSAAVFSHGAIEPKDASLAYVMVFYIIFGFCSILAIRALEHGANLFLLIFISAWVSDTCAYFTGVCIGKHKLIPDVSPKKTVEGAVGGLVGCVAAFVIFGVIMGSCYDLCPNYLILGLMGLVLSVISMCGDLIASLVKRSFGIKDYSKLIPGHGGIMDRFDSIIATASVMYVLMSIPYIANNIL